MTQLYQSEALIGATLLSLLLCLFSPSHTIPPPAPRATWIGVYVPPRVQYSMYKDGEEEALMVAVEEEEEEEDT